MTMKQLLRACVRACCSAYLDRCGGLAGVIDADLAVLADGGQQLAVRAPGQAEDLPGRHVRGFSST